MELILSMYVSECCLNPALLVQTLEYFSPFQARVDQQMGTENLFSMGENLRFLLCKYSILWEKREAEVAYSSDKLLDILRLKVP